MVLLLDAVMSDVGHRAAVHREQQRAKLRPLRVSYVDSDSGRLVLAHLDELGPAFQVGLQPVERSFAHSELEPQAVEEEPVVDCIKG